MELIKSMFVEKIHVNLDKQSSLLVVSRTRVCLMEVRAKNTPMHEVSEFADWNLEHAFEG